mmetsp:Transcript_63635/g.189749  ORF Transcript_63635/g.189749 Transcript_63635/m.189749 type:complete len:299 (+) Transcript_63635:1-897(+)
MSPLPCWLSGMQHVALNMTNVDIPAQLHYALFNGSGGFVLKPLEMLGGGLQAEGKEQPAQTCRDDDYWPPRRLTVQRATVQALSLHNLPKRGEQRPRYDGRRGACHKYAPGLSGEAASPHLSTDSSSPSIKASLHPIGGFCAVSKRLPLPDIVETEMVTSSVKANGLCAQFGEKIHCVAAEPHTTFLRVEVSDLSQEVAYAIAVLGRLKPGYRVLQLRSYHGTKIELAYLFVRISFAKMRNIWPSARQVRMNVAEYYDAIDNLKENVKALGEQEGTLGVRTALERLSSASQPGDASTA